MTLDEHCQESVRLFGNPYEHIHLWLDEFAGTAEYGYRHRRKRHHAEGMCRAVALFGPEAEEVARRHIISDLMQEGWTEKDCFPRDEADYVRMGLY